MAASAFETKTWPEGQALPEQNQRPRAKILLVEDDLAVLEELYDVIHLEGWKPLTASSVEAGMRLLKADPDIDVVVTDVHFANDKGVANGIQFISRARAKFPDRELTYIVLSGDPDKVRCSLHEGAFKFLPKPLNSDKLITIINDAVDRKYRQKQPSNLLPFSGSPS